MAAKYDPNAVVTRGLLDEAVDAILEGVGKMIKEEVGQVRTELKETRTELKTEIAHVKDEIQGLKADLSTKADRAELNVLKEKVDRYHPTH